MCYINIIHVTVTYTGNRLEYCVLRSFVLLLNWQYQVMRSALTTDYKAPNTVNVNAIEAFMHFRTKLPLYNLCVNSMRPSDAYMHQ